MTNEEYVENAGVLIQGSPIVPEKARIQSLRDGRKYPKTTSNVFPGRSKVSEIAGMASCNGESKIYENAGAFFQGDLEIFEKYECNVQGNLFTGDAESIRKMRVWCFSVMEVQKTLMTCYSKG